MSSSDRDDDEKTVLAWLDGADDGEKPAPAKKAAADKAAKVPPAPDADDERTIMMPLPVPPKPPVAQAEMDGERTVFGVALPGLAVPPSVQKTLPDKALDRSGRADGAAAAPGPAETGHAETKQDDEWTISAPLPMPGTGLTQPPAPVAPPPPEPAQKTVLDPLPMPGSTQPPRPRADVAQVGDAPAVQPAPLPSASKPVPVTAQSDRSVDQAPDDEADQTWDIPPDPVHPPHDLAPPELSPAAETEDDDRTVIGAPLDWFDAETTPPAAVSAASTARPPEDATEDAATDDWGLPDPVTVSEPVPAEAPADADDHPDSGPLPSFALLPAALRPVTAILRFIPRETWTPEETVEQALLGHGLTQALRRAARRAPRGLGPDQRDALIRDAGQRLRHPTDSFLDDGLLTTFRQMVATRVQDLAMEELDVEPEMPSGLDPKEQLQWRALGKGLFVLLRDLERRAVDKPRIGKNTRLHDRIVKLGQDPFSGMPESDVARYDPSQKVPMIRAQFMGFFGPFGAFPLNWTEEVQQWVRNGDDGFVAFVDIFTFRFQELFFRAWSDARAITQFDHPTGNRFQDYMLTFAGNGTPAMQNRDDVSDTVKARYAGLAGGRVKSPTRLRQMLQLHFNGKLRVEIEELVPTWLDFEPDTLSHLGMQSCSMGMNMHLGSRVRSVGEKIRIHLYVTSIKHYFDLLPGGYDHAHLRDLVFWYLGEAYEIETVIWLPQPEIQPAVMGVSAQLGWMACIAPPKGDPDKMVQVTVFKLLPLKGQVNREAA